jgi:hypothetical protein
MGDLTISNNSDWGNTRREIVGGVGPSDADAKKGFSLSACSALFEAATKASEAQSNKDPAKAATKHREAADLAACADPGLAAYYLRQAGLKAQDAGEQSAANADFEKAHKLDEQKQCWLGM